MKKKINKKKLLGVIVQGVGLDFANKKSYQIKQDFHTQMGTTLWTMVFKKIWEFFITVFF